MSPLRPGRSNFPGGAPWEPVAGYSRAVRAGDHIHVSGTTATDAEGRVMAPGDAAAQTAQTLANVRRALERAGASLDDVVRTRIYVTDIARWEEIARVHGQVFAGILPACSMVEVRALIDPEMLVEIEADAWVGAAGGRPGPE